MTSIWYMLILTLRRMWFRRSVHPLFDVDYYQVTNPDVVAARVAPYHHYVTYGWREGRFPNAFFDPIYYSKRWGVPLVDALDHYWLIGAASGHDPHPKFETTWYLKFYPDVAAARINPLRHYLEFGHDEGRLTQSPGRSGLLVKAMMEGAVLTCCEGQLVLGPHGASRQASSVFHPEYALLLWLSHTQFKFMLEYITGSEIAGTSITQLVLPSDKDDSVACHRAWVTVIFRMATVSHFGGNTAFEFAEAVIVKLVRDEPPFVFSCSGDAISITWRSGSN